jgi:hypothetical protein
LSCVFFLILKEQLKDRDPDGRLTFAPALPQTTEDVPMLRELEKFYNTSVDEMPMNVADLI